MTGPYIKPTVFSGDWVNLKYDTTPINYFEVLSGTPSSISESQITYSTSSNVVNYLNPQYYSFNRPRPFLQNSNGLLPGPLDESRVSQLQSSRWSFSAQDIMYNSTFYELKSASSIIKVEIAKRVPHIFSLQFSSINNTKYIPLIIRPFGASFGFNTKIYENINTGIAGADNRTDINAVTGIHFHNPTFDSYIAYKTPYVLPEDREVGLGLPMYSKAYLNTPSSLIFIGAIRPFDFVAASGEHPGTYYSEKGTGSFANPVFWQSLIMAQEYNFNWYNMEGVHKVKYYYYNNKDLLGVSSGQHLVQFGIDLYLLNTFNKGYLYRPDIQDTYDLNNYIYRPSVTGTSLFGPVTDVSQSSLFTSAPVFKVEYICNSGTENDQDPYVIDQRQGLWHTVFHYDFSGIGGNIFADQGKLIIASSHPYVSSVFGGDSNAYFASGLWDGWNCDPSYPFTYDVRYGPKSGIGKPYVCPIFVLDSDNLFGTTSKVCVGIYTKLSPQLGSDTRPNSISIGQRREQLYSLFNQNQYYRPESPSSHDGGTNAKFGPFTYEDVNAGGYCTIYSNYTKNFTKGWKMLEYWLVIGETKDEIISKIDKLHQMGVAEPGPTSPELELPQAILNSILMPPVKGTI